MMRRNGTALVLILTAWLAAATPPAADQPLMLGPMGPVAESAPAVDPPRVAAPEDPEKVPPPRVRVRGGQHAPYSRLVFDWPEPVGFQLHRDDGAATVTFDASARFDLRHAMRAPLTHIGKPRPVGEPGAAALRFKIPAGGSVRGMTIGTKVVIDVYPPRETPPSAPAPATKPLLAPTPPTPQAAASAASTGAPATAAAESPAAGPTSRIAAPSATPAAAPSAETTPTAPAARADTGTSAPWTMRWDHPVGLAAFRRGETLWFVFDAPGDPDLAALAGAAGTNLGAIRRLPHEAATVILAHSPRGVHVHAARDGFDWTITLAGRRPEGLETLAPRVDPAAEPARRFFVSAPDLGPLLAVTDPVIGDTLIVAPLRRPGIAMRDAFDYPRFRLLATEQGLAIRPNVDDLVVTPGAEGLLLAVGGPPHVSPPTAASASAAPLDRRPLFRFAAFTGSGGEKFTHGRRTLQRAVAKADPRHREAARVDLAEFYLAHRFAAEALGLARLMVEDRPAIEAEGRFRGLRGLARSLLGRHGEAVDDLAHRSLTGNADAATWLAAARFAEARTPISQQTFAGALRTLKGYPPALAVPARLAFAEAALASGLAEDAATLLAELHVTGVPEDERARLDFLQGQLEANTGQVDQALRRWGRLANSADRHAATRATLARTEFMLESGALSPAEAIAALEPLRFAWRGDRLEYDILRRLAALRDKEGDTAAALTTLGEAKSLFPALAAADDAEAEMAAMFERLFRAGNEDALSPLRAVALFNAHDDLLPAGPNGDRIVGDLVDRLVAVDLLDEAATMLQDRLVPGATPAARAEIGAEIARLRLLDDRPAEALAILDRTRAADPGADLAIRRARLRAEALAATGDGAGALDLLADDASIAAERLRVTVYRRDEDWRSAADSLNRILIASNPEPSGPLTDSQAETILDLAVAHSLAGNAFTVRQIHARFAEAMAATPVADAFRLVAGGDVETAGTATAIAQSVEAAVNFAAGLRGPSDRGGAPEAMGDAE